MNLKSTKIILLTAFLMHFPLSGQQIKNADYYFDAENGNDSNSGTYNSPKKTIAGLVSLGNAINGKTIAFRDSMYYRTSGDMSTVLDIVNMANVRLTNYWNAPDEDIGSYPRIRFSKEINNWENQGGNIWSANGMVNNTLVYTYGTDAKIDSLKWGIPRAALGELDDEREFYINGSNVYCYSPEDPDNRYACVDAQYSTVTGISVSGVSNNITIDHLRLEIIGIPGSKSNMVLFKYPAENNTIRDCYVGYLGDYNRMLTGQGGNGISLNASNSYCINNVVEEIGQHVIRSFAYYFELTNIVIDSNTCINTKYYFFDFNGYTASGNTGSISGIKVRWNVAYDTPWENYRVETGFQGGGGVWTNTVVQDMEFAYNLIYDLHEICFQMNIGACHIYNNTVVQSPSNKIIIYANGGPGSIFKNNLFYHRTGNVGSFPSGSSNNFTSDPNFANFNWDDFTRRDMHLTSGSGAINYGTYLGYTKDLDGNPIVGNPDAGSYEGTFGPDITPPEVTGGILQDSVTLHISFSEALDPASAQNPNNYSITSGISVLSASLSNSHVTLTTSTHSPGIYTLTVLNVEDIAGNQITNNNTAQYEMVENPYLQLEQLDIINVTASVVPEPVHSPEKTIDGLGLSEGNYDSRWAGDTMPEWLIFDLGVTKEIALTKLSFFNWDQGRIYNYSVAASTDMSQWQEILINAQSNLAEWTDNEFDAINARYIKVVFNSSNQNSWAGLWECQIWGFNPTPVEDEESMPEVFKLEQNYPNPFNPNTNIQYVLNKRSFISLRVYDILGNEVAMLVNEEKPSGKHTVSFNGARFTSGVYIYKMSINNFVTMKKMLLLK